MKKEKRVFFERYSPISWLLVLAIAVFIFIMSSLSFRGGAPGPSYSTIIYHFFIFFWFAFFILMAIVRASRASLIIPAIFLAIIYAVSDEFHQLFVPGRACSFSDFLVDSSGILLASLLYLITIRIRKKNNLLDSDYY